MTRRSSSGALSSLFKWEERKELCKAPFSSIPPFFGVEEKRKETLGTATPEHDNKGGVEPGPPRTASPKCRSETV